MVNFESVIELIKASLSDAKVEITDLTGTQDHLGIQIISDSFEGKSIIEQHQVIMDILKERLKTDIHAVQLKTMTFSKAKDRGLI